MRSGVIRIKVRPLRPCRMISWPAAWGIRWVKPSSATVSPSRTADLTASASELICAILTVVQKCLCGPVFTAGVRHGQIQICRGQASAHGRPTMTASPAIGASDVLVVVDVQNDFCPGGRLAVPKGDEVVPLINRLAQQFSHVVLTQDWHPHRHHSFASSHQGKKPFDVISLPY